MNWRNNKARNRLAVAFMDRRVGAGHSGWGDEGYGMNPNSRRAASLNYRGSGKVAKLSASPREYSMIDSQMNAEEVAEDRKQREAADNATDDGMPVAPEGKVGDVDDVQDIKPEQ
jgi:hypothetical protein